MATSMKYIKDQKLWAGKLYVLFVEFICFSSLTELTSFDMVDWWFYS